MKLAGEYTEMKIIPASMRMICEVNSRRALYIIIGVTVVDIITKSAKNT